LDGKPEENIALEGPTQVWEDNIKIDRKDTWWDCMDWIVWLRKGKSGGILWTQKRTFRLSKVLGISWLAEKQSASHKGLSPSLNNYTLDIVVTSQCQV
jgi:hypothetical protein